MSLDDDKELLEIRRKKEEELRKRLEQERAMRMVLSEILTPEALERLDNVSLAHPELAEQAKVLILQLAQAGQLKIPVDEDTLKSILIKLYSNRLKTGSIKISRK